MSQLTSSDPRKEKFSKWYKLGIAAVICLVISPIIFMIVKGAIGGIIAFGLGFAAIQLAPFVSIKLATWNIKLITKDAEENPVETRIQIEQDTERELDKFNQEIKTFEASLFSFEDSVKEIVRKYPDKTDQYIQQVNELKQLLTVRQRAWEEYRANLKAYKAETIEISELWDIANASVRMGKIAGTMKSNPMKELRTRVADKAVHNKLNLARAELSAALREESTVPALSVSKPQFLEVSVKEVARVPNSR